MEIIKATSNNIKDVVEISQILWNKNSTEKLEKLEKEYQNTLNREDSVIFLLLLKSKVIGFAHCQLRYEYVEGTNSSPVGYLEGIFISENYRKFGHASKLIQFCESWLKEKGCTEFASDSEINNIDSYNFHKSNGFTEANKIVCYTKEI